MDKNVERFVATIDALRVSVIVKEAFDSEIVGQTTLYNIRTDIVGHDMPHMPAHTRRTSVQICWALNNLAVEPEQREAMSDVRREEDGLRPQPIVRTEGFWLPVKHAENDYSIGYCGYDNNHRFVIRYVGEMDWIYNVA